MMNSKPLVDASFSVAWTGSFRVTTVPPSPLYVAPCSFVSVTGWWKLSPVLLSSSNGMRS